MNVLITGATGFIGNHVIETILKTGGNILVTATYRSIDKAKKCSWFDKVNYIECNLTEKRSVEKLFKGIDVVIHLAWDGLPNYDELFHFERNVPDNYFFIKSAVEAGIKKVVVTGTCFEYGMVDGALSENSITNPTNPYGLAKDTLRKYIQELQKKHSFQYNWLRLFYCYGEGQNEKSFYSQLRRSLEKQEESFNMSGGEQLRDFLPVEELANYIVAISLQEKFNGVVNCCSGKPISLRSLAEKIIQESGKSIRLNLGFYPYTSFEPMAFWGDNTLLSKIIAND
jgi:nucleoside-diphosphate-sugar epimerase